MGIGKSGLQKARLDLALLPPLKVIDNDTVGYYVRYRFVSEDRNRLSHWSPNYLLTPPYEFRRPSGKGLGDFLAQKQSSGIVDIAWDTINVYNNNNFVRKAIGYDIWLRWSRNGDNGDWKYEERVSNTSLSLLVPPTYFINGVEQGSPPNQLEVEIYARSQDVLRDANHQQLLLYKTPIRINV